MHDHAVPPQHELKFHLVKILRSLNFVAPYNALQCQFRQHLWVLTGAQDKDANIRTKAVGIVGSAVADTKLRSQHSHAELLVLLTHRYHLILLAYCH